MKTILMPELEAHFLLQSRHDCTTTTSNLQDAVQDDVSYILDLADRIKHARMKAASRPNDD